MTQCLDQVPRCRGGSSPGVLAGLGAGLYNHENARVLAAHAFHSAEGAHFRMTTSTPNEFTRAIAAAYDETPYVSPAFPQTHPDKLCAMARLFGLDAPAPARARVLELGCADGSNLLPMAQHAPEARF